MFTRRRFRPALSALLSVAIGAALVGLGTTPADADDIPENLYPIENTYRGYINDNNPAISPPFSSVVYDNGTYDGQGNPVPCDVTVQPGGYHTVVYPTTLLANHPVVVWGNGTTGTIGIPWWIPFIEEQVIEDSTCIYQEVLKHLASFGFIVIAPNDGFVGSGTELLVAIDEIEARNSAPTDPLYQKVDESTILVAGHSQGAVGAINAAATDANEMDDRISGVLALSAPDEAYCATQWEQALNELGWEFDCYAPDAVEDINDDVPVFFVNGETECDDTALMRTWFSWWLDVEADEEDLAEWVEDPANTPCIATNATNQAFFNAKSGAAAKATAMSDAAGEHAGHIDSSEGMGYVTAWLAHVSGNAGFSGVEDAFCGTSPEIASNSGWTNWQAKNLPCS